MNPPYENPAQRLSVILTLLRAKNANRPVRQALGETLGPSPEDTAGLVLALAAIIDLAERVERRVTETGSTGPRSHWIEPVRAAIGHLANLDKQLSFALLPLHEGTVVSLEACAELFAPTTEAKPDAPEHHLAHASDLADALLIELAAAGLDPGAHELLVRHVLALQNAIKLYKVVGPEGVYDAILSTSAALRVSVPAAETTTPWYRNVRENLSTIADTLTIVTASGTAVAAITQMLNV